MSIERTVREQARQALSGKWAVAVAGLFTFMLFIAALYHCFTLFENILVLFVPETGSGYSDQSLKVTALITCGLLLTAYALGIAFVSPVKNGFYRLFYNIANGYDAELSDVFYYFYGNTLGKSRYLAAIIFNIRVFLFKLLYFVISYSGYFISLILGSEIVSTLFFAAGTVCFVFLLFKLIPAQFIFTENDYEEPSVILSVSSYIYSRHGKDFIILFFTFTPWLLLCFFVLPALFVFPYLVTSAAVSSKWLIKLYKEGKMV